jgi:N-acetylglucosamine kinase-like BadF-type ATPase
LVYKAALLGDPTALSIIQWTGRELGHTAAAVIRQLGIEGLEFEVVLVGSVYEMGELLIAPMREVITSKAQKATLVRLSSPPVIGGVLLAMEQVGLNPYMLREPLIRSTQGLLNTGII